MERILDVRELTERQQALISLLEANNKPLTNLEVYLNIEGYKLSDNPNAHDLCPAINSDVHAINNSNYEKIIVIDNFTYYLATKEEAKKYLMKLWKSIIPKIKRANRIAYKYNLDGQEKWTEEELKIISSFYENEIYID